MAFALTFGAALAYENAPVAVDMRSIVQDDGITYAALDNGVTFAGAVDPGVQCMSVVGSGAGGMVAEGASGDLRSITQDDHFTYRALNGATFSGEAFGPTCSWAGVRELDLHNGISIPGGTK